MALFPIIQIVYWLALSTWFGGVLFIALAAPIVFRTVRESKPLLPMVLSVNLENQHADLLAGSIVGNLLAMLSKLQPFCGLGVLIGLVGQWFLSNWQGPGLLVQMDLRSLLLVAAIALMVYQGRVVWPRIEKYRKEYIDHADEPDVANAAKDQFDKYHQESVTVLMILLCILLGMVLFSGGIAAKPSFTLTRS